MTIFADELSNSGAPLPQATKVVEFTGARRAHHSHWQPGAGRVSAKTPQPIAGSRLIPSGFGRSETLMIEHLGDVVDLIFGDGCTEAIFHLAYHQLPGSQGYGGLFVQEIRRVTHQAIGIENLST